MKDIVKDSYGIFLKRYEKSLADKGINKDVINNRKSTIKKFLDFLSSYPNNPKFENITRSDVELFITNADEKYSPATVARYFSFLKKFFLFYKKENVNTNNIFDDWSYDKFIEKRFTFLDDEQIENLYEQIKGKKLTLKSMRDEIIFLILAYTGCSIGEIRSLNVYKNNEISIDDENYIVIEESKIYFTGESGREIKLPFEVTNKINIYLNELINKKSYDYPNCLFLFPSIRDSKDKKLKRLSNNTFWKIFKDAINKSELIKDKSVSIRNIRHTFINRLVKEEIPLEIISDITGLDISSLKPYINSELFEFKKDTVLKNQHPFKNVFNKL
ncbi:site-specific integrase [Ruminiclostridium herbifermentans]|uniref:Site-specific integrase n=1 Tax=Ruminiclostridium herbifermentans TaxID=2488810 RepID=A0A4U7J5L7_9FIRM|nr:site-specific integrase [Ruminiclostridium herbifermentans]QNU66731.1 site-specific integrase [Ruminiclostridium herbifermentans]